MPGPPEVGEWGMPKIELDELDRRILAELGADARLTQVALAARVGLSRSAVQERLKRLERDGVILGSPGGLARDKARGVRPSPLGRGPGASHDRAVRTLETYPEVRVADSV